MAASTTTLEHIHACMSDPGFQADNDGYALPAEVAKASRRNPGLCWPSCITAWRGASSRADRIPPCATTGSASRSGSTRPWADTTSQPNQPHGMTASTALGHSGGAPACPHNAHRSSASAGGVPIAPLMPLPALAHADVRSGPLTLTSVAGPETNDRSLTVVTSEGGAKIGVDVPRKLQEGRDLESA